MYNIPCIHKLLFELKYFYTVTGIKYSYSVTFVSPKAKLQMSLLSLSLATKKQFFILLLLIFSLNQVTSGMPGISNPNTGLLPKSSVQLYNKKFAL